jgi:hypothetical protein
VIVDVSILFPVAWPYVIFVRPSVFCGARRLSFSCPLLFVIGFLAVFRGSRKSCAYDDFVEFAVSS